MRKCFLVLFILAVGCDVPEAESQQASYGAVEQSQVSGRCACLANAAQGTIPMVMQDGTLGASSLRQIGDVVYVNRQVIVVVGKDIEEDELERLAAEGASLLALNGSGGIGLLGKGETGVKGQGKYAGCAGFTSGGYGLLGFDDADGDGVYGNAAKGTGVRGDGKTGVAGYGVGFDEGAVGVEGWVDGRGLGVKGQSYTGSGVYGGSNGGGNGFYTPNALHVGEPAQASERPDPTWIDCPETGECTCPDGLFVTKTADRGARIFCSGR